MSRGQRTAALLCAVLFFGPSRAEERPKPKGDAVGETMRDLGKQVERGAKKLAEALTPAWDMAARGAQSLLASAKSIDSAMSGCTLKQREQFEFSSSAEYFFGRALAAEHIGALGADELGAAHPVSRYVDQVGQLLAFAAEAYGEQNVRERWSDLPERGVDNRPWPYGGYHFIVLDREEPNAFGGPGGVVMVTTGLLRLLQDEDELAAVLAHEVAHVQRGHGVELVKAFMCQESEQEKASAPVKAVAAAARDGADKLPGGILQNAPLGALNPLFAHVADQARAVFDVGYPRAFELEADRIGLRYLQVLGYDVRAMPRVFERLEHGSKEEAYGVTHPRFDTRMKVVTPVISLITRGTAPEESSLARRKARFEAAIAQLKK